MQYECDWLFGVESHGGVKFKVSFHVCTTDMDLVWMVDRWRLSNATMWTGAMKRFDNEESDEAGGCYAQTSLPPEQWVARYETKVSKVSVGINMMALII